MEIPHEYAVNGIIFAFLGTGSGVTDCDRR